MASRILQMQTAAGTALSNSTTEASLARWSIPAGMFQPGKQFRIGGSARVTAQNSTDTLAVAVRFGSNSTVTSNTSCALAAAVDAAVSDVVCVQIELDIHSATRAVMRVSLSDADAEGSSGLLKAYHEILTIADGTAYYLDLTGVWSVASASNSVQSESFTVVEVV